jgi:hypothetical protein
MLMMSLMLLMLPMLLVMMALMLLALMLRLLLIPLMFVADDVDVAVVGTGMRDGIEKSVVVEEAAVFDTAVDAGDILHHHKPSAEVEVTDFGVPHLARRQSHMLLRGINQGRRAARAPAIEIRRAGLLDGVADEISAFTEPIENRQQDRTWSNISHG